MTRVIRSVSLGLLITFVFAFCVNAQTATYHLHKEASSTSGLFQLKTAGPDGTTLAIQSANLKNLAVGEYVVKAFDTQSGVPNASGVIPAGSTITFTLWMNKTSTSGVIFPRAKLRLNNATGTLFCTATGSTALTTTLTKYTFSGTTSSNVSMTTADRFYLWVGVNVTTVATSNTNAVVNVEGTLNGNYDSLIIIPTPMPPPAISNLSVTSGVVGTSVTINGSNFGSTQGTNTVTFNGTAATPTSWSATNIAAPVPTGATTGPVIVTINGAASNAVNFTVTPKINSLSPTSGAVNTSVTISGTTFGATQGTSTVTFNGTTATPTSWSSSSIVAPVPAGSTTGLVLVTAGGQASNGITFAVAATGTIAGTITRTSDGAALSGALIEALQASVVKASTTSAANGSYAISNVDVGNYDVRVSASGYQTRTENGVVVTANTPTTVNQSLDVPPGNVNYIYDKVGRLKAVVTPAETAIYTYDAVGNLLSISRGNSSQVSIIEFTPNGGPIGAEVRIFGTAFSATPNQNSVTFNGAAASVISASAVEIVANVPSGATTGLISVTTPSGSASSSASFVVTDSNAPTITGFSPTVGSAGTAVIISGTNFETTATNDVAKFNSTYAQISSATATSVSTNVPTAAASGRIRISTPNGSAISSDDFFIPPPPYTSTDLSSTGRIVMSEIKTVTVAANKIGIVLFDGNAGQRVSFGISSGTMGWAQISVLNPNGTKLINPSWVNGGGFLDTKTLPITGTYTIVIDPEDANTGSINIQLYEVPADVSGTLSAGGSPFTVTTTTPGQNARITFQGTANEKVFLIASNVAMGGTGWSLLSILRPDGSTLVSPTWVNVYGKTFDTVTLPASGVYTIVVDPETANIGSMVLRLYHPSLTNDDFADATVISGSSSSVTGTNSGATKESGEPNHAGQVGGKSAWYRWQASQTGNVTISTAASNFDTLLGVYTGSSVNSLTTIASNDDDSPGHTSRLTFSAVANTTYYIAVDGFDNTTGNIVLNWSVENTAVLQGDYRFQNSRASSTGQPPDVTDLGTNGFASATVDGNSTTVLTFSQNNGLSLAPTTGVVANDAYTLVVLFSLAQTNSYRRVADFKNGTSDHGLYVLDGRLYFYPAAYGSAVSISDNTYVQVVLTRDASGVVTGYVNGTQQFQFTDTGAIAIIDGGNTLRFFRDDGSEASAGSVARFRIYNGALTATQVAALDRLP